ncbi:unnamed protein product (macronuclear) [Paramecium tetraurelia]|uniref:Uncharacterized protein n=1 Tax=Paramecium tetraurelia TaxID=5888 RepID=A0CAS1_PARTE|nr:uncharacterized protein GSPATT00036669001 [Paramecium tetraurelia]CAK67888.1 unnamed protein product [Paramecium tetraurelia]|eukprot:XP_001435285.1 hypothetical protein (macronuclear) [Paramecium tetraurelia strain d4-2]
MYKLNTIQGHSFLNFQAPLNYFSKRKLFQLANEIKPRKRDSLGRVVLSSSLPKSFWFRDYDQVRVVNKKLRESRPNNHRIQNPVYFKRKEVQECLLHYTIKASTPNPSKKWKKYRNLMLENNYHVQMSREQIKQKFQDTLNFLIPNKQSSPPKSQRGSFMYSQQQQCLFEHRTSQQSKLKRVSRQTSNRKDDSMRSIDRHFQDIDCQQSNFNHSYIQDKMIPSNQITPRNRFFKDCFRLYGIDSQVLAPKNKLIFTDSVQLVESQETRCDKNEGIQSYREKSNQKQNNLLNLIKKQRQKNLQTKTISPKQPKLNTSTSKDNKIVNIYFPSLKKINVRNLS